MNVLGMKGEHTRSAEVDGFIGVGGHSQHQGEAVVLGLYLVVAPGDCRPSLVAWKRKYNFA